MSPPQSPAVSESSKCQEWPVSGPMSKLPGELVVAILEHLRPSGPLSTKGSNCHNPSVERAYFSSRSSFASLCAVSKWTRSFATEYLYHTIVLASNVELLHFFRTITNNPSLRPKVYSFAWAVALEDDQVEFDGSEFIVAESAPLDPSCWEAIKWPLLQDDICQIMSITDSGGSAYWKLLGAIFAMAPNIQSIFTLQTRWRSGMIHYCPGNELFMKLINPSSVSKTFLQRLRTITLEPWPGSPSYYVAETIAALLINSPIHRIEVKYCLSFNEILETANRWGLENFSAECVKELFLYKLWPSPNEISHIGTLFPNLTCLELDYLSSYYKADHDSIEGMTEGLLPILGTLERLSIACGPPTDESGPVLSEPILPDLRKMKVLKHLSITSVWLFGAKDALSELQQLDNLPETLESFHLLDNQMDGGRDWNSEQHPIHQQTPVYEEALSRLQKNCLVRLRRLKVVILVLSARHFGEDAERLISRFKPLFALCGIAFRVITSKKFRMEAFSSWANLGSGNH